MELRASKSYSNNTKQRNMIQSNNLNGDTKSMGCIHFVRYSNKLLLMSMTPKSMKTNLKQLKFCLITQVKSSTVDPL